MTWLMCLIMRCCICTRVTSFSFVEYSFYLSFWLFPYDPPVFQVYSCHQCLSPAYPLTICACLNSYTALVFLQYAMNNLWGHFYMNLLNISLPMKNIRGICWKNAIFMDNSVFITWSENWMNRCNEYAWSALYRCMSCMCLFIVDILPRLC